MYSPDGRKEWYLRECKESIYEDNTISLIERIFNSTELEENAFDKDISEFNDDEAIDYLKSLNSKSRQRLKVYSWYLSRYRSWYWNKQNIQNVLDPFDDRTIDKIIEGVIPDSTLSEQIITEDLLKEYIEIEPDYINKFIVISLWYGIKGDEYIDLVNLKISDLDETNKTVKLQSGRIVKADDYFIVHMKKAYSTDTYIKPIQGMNRNINQLKYVNSDYIIRRTANSKDITAYNNPVQVKFINARLFLIRKNIGNENFTVSNIYKNGLINYIKKRYAEKNISLKTALLEKDLTKKSGRYEGYTYDSETQKYIDEFGSKNTVRLLRMQIRENTDIY